MNYWVNKLTSRKLWVAVAAFVSGLIVAFGGNAETAETVTGLIMAGATAVAYIFAEGLVDAKGATGDVIVNAVPLAETEPPDEEE